MLWRMHRRVNESRGVGSISERRWRNTESRADFGGGLFNERARDSTESGAFSFVGVFFARGIPRMNPMRRQISGLAGLHLFQEVSTLGQQLAHTLLLRQGHGRIKPMFERPLQLTTPH